MKTIYYTCNYGNYDKWDYPEGTLVFSNDTEGRRESRFYKINSHLLPPHDISVYFDGSREWKGHPTDLAEQLDGEWGAFKHPVRSCIYQEFTEVKGKLSDPTLVDKQRARYEEAGYGTHKGLYENAVIVRRNTPTVKKLNEMWWQEYEEGCERDQVSLPYVFWKNDFKPQVFSDSRDYTIGRGHL